MYLALARGDATPLRDALAALPAIPEDCQWANFVRNHDELTLDKLSEDERAEVFAAFGPEEELQLYGRGLRRRLPTMVGGDERRIRMLYSLAFALPGTPVLFYGEEIGMAENLEIPGRYSVRAPMQWSGDRHGGFSTAEDADALCRPVVAAEGWGPERVNVAAQRRDPGSLLNWMERLIRRRRECPELGWGALHAARRRPRRRALPTAPTGTGAPCSRCTRSPAERLEARVDARAGGRARPSTCSTARTRRPRDGTLTVPLDPYGARWFRLRRDGQRLAAVGSARVAPHRRLLRRGHARTDRWRWHWASCWRSSLRRPRRRRRRRATRSRTPSFRGEVPTAQQVLGIDLGDRDVTTAESDRYLLAVDARQPARDERRGRHVRAGPRRCATRSSGARAASRRAAWPPCARAPRS